MGRLANSIAFSFMMMMMILMGELVEIKHAAEYSLEVGEISGLFRSALMITMHLFKNNKTVLLLHKTSIQTHNQGICFSGKLLL